MNKKKSMEKTCLGKEDILNWWKFRLVSGFKELEKNYNISVKQCFLNKKTNAKKEIAIRSKAESTQFAGRSNWDLQFYVLSEDFALFLLCVYIYIYM